MTTVSPVPSERLTTSVRAFMRPGVITVPEHATLLEAKRAMVHHGVHAVLIVGLRQAAAGWGARRRAAPMA